MLLTRKSDAARAPADAASPFVHRLRRGLSQALPTMDRRAFLRRSGLGVGVGLAATQLTLMKKAQAAGAADNDVGAGKVVVRRTVCTHCSVGCAVDAVIENALGRDKAALLAALTGELRDALGGSVPGEN